MSYAPVSGRIAEEEVIVDPRKPDLISRLKKGKNFLRNQEPDKAFTEFKSALELAQKLEDPIEEKKAARGVGTIIFLVHMYINYATFLEIRVLTDTQSIIVNSSLFRGTYSYHMHLWFIM